MAGKLTEFEEKAREIEALIALPVDGGGDERVEYHGMSVAEAVERSTILKAIYRAGVNISSIEWFDKRQASLATEIGTAYRDIRHHLKSFRAARKREDEFSFLVWDSRCLKDFLDILTRFGVISVEFVLYRKAEDTKARWSRFDNEKYAFSGSHHYLVIYKVVDARLAHLVNGDWMTCFIAGVIADHLDRNEIGNEVFTKVTYSAPVDVLQSRSDFDVVAHFADKAYFFECKSGQISGALGTEVLEKSTQIREVLKRFAPGIADLRFFVVFDDEVNDTDEILEMFEGRLVEPRKIDQIRALVHDESL